MSKKILVIEDDDIALRLIDYTLRKEGHEVLLAKNGLEGISKAQSEEPDLVILDIRMPEMDGIEALGKVVGRFKKIPVILNTAYSSYKEDFRSWAAEAYVVKSSDLSELKGKIKEILGGREDG